MLSKNIVYLVNFIIQRKNEPLPFPIREFFDFLDTGKFVFNFNQNFFNFFFTLRALIIFFKSGRINLKYIGSMEVVFKR